MAHLYIALVDTPGFFAALIRKFLKQRYIHVVISADAGLNEAYSVGRRNPAIPFFAGFEREYKNKIIQSFPTAYYRIGRLNCTQKQKEMVMERLNKDYRRRWHIHYAVLGLPFVVLGIPFYLTNQYTCSSYVARILQENGIVISKKHFSLVTPKDFYHTDKLRILYEGPLSDMIDNTDYSAGYHCGFGGVSAYE